MDTALLTPSRKALVNITGASPLTVWTGAAAKISHQTPKGRNL
jgi:hypothetical protein